MTQVIHILNQMGVLTSFSVAKKVTEKDINKYFSKHKRSGKSERQIGEMLKEKILEDIDKAIENNQVPGLIPLSQSNGVPDTTSEFVKRMPELNRLIMIISHKLSEKKYDKMEMCYFIHSMVNLLGLTEDDFTRFHHQNGTEDGDDDDDGEDDKAF